VTLNHRARIIIWILVGILVVGGGLFVYFLQKGTFSSGAATLTTQTTVNPNCSACTNTSTISGTILRKTSTGNKVVPGVAVHAATYNCAKSGTALCSKESQPSNAYGKFTMTVQTKPTFANYTLSAAQTKLGQCKYFIESSVKTVTVKPNVPITGVQLFGSFVDPCE